MKLVLFDLDDTLFDGDTEGQWVEYMDQNKLITASDFFKKMKSFENSYRQGNLDVVAYSEFLLSPLIGKRLEDIKDNIDIFVADIVNRLTDDLTKELLDKHKDDTKILTSGSLSFLVDKIAHKLGIETSFGTDPNYVEEKFTGEVKGNPNFSEEKVRRIKIWKDSKQFEEIFAYSDSIHDLPLLEFSDIAITISPDDRLRKIAKKRNWLIFDGRKSYS